MNSYEDSSREDWCRSIQLLTEAYQYKAGESIFHYNLVRTEGASIQGIEKPVPLGHLYEEVEELAKCVISGNIHR